MNAENKIPEVWALLDNVTGHNTQVLGVAESLGLPFHKKKIEYNEKAEWPNFLKLNGLATIDKSKSDNIAPPYPDIVISCGRKAASVAMSIKKTAKKNGVKTFAAHILWPGFPTNGLDLVAVPLHDSIAKKNKKKLFKFLGAPNRISREFLLNEYRIWARTIGDLPSPKITVLVGGDSKNNNFTMEHASRLVDGIVQICGHLKAAALVTTSRRTNADVARFMEDELKKRLGKYIYFHDFNRSKANPFYAYLQLADMIIVTGDSVSMISESCATGKPVYVYSPDGNAAEKHRAFQLSLAELGFVNFFDDEAKRKIIESGVPVMNRAGKNLNSAVDIAAEIKRRSKLFT